MEVEDISRAVQRDARRYDGRIYLVLRGRNGMRLSSMRYKNYTWPHNPETFVVEYRRQMAAHKVPFGGCVLQDLGVNCRILPGRRRVCGAGGL